MCHEMSCSVMRDCPLPRPCPRAGKAFCSFPIAVYHGFSCAAVRSGRKERQPAGSGAPPAAPPVAGEEAATGGGRRERRRGPARGRARGPPLSGPGGSACSRHPGCVPSRGPPSFPECPFRCPRLIAVFFEPFRPAPAISGPDERNLATAIDKVQYRFTFKSIIFSYRNGRTRKAPAARFPISVSALGGHSPERKSLCRPRSSAPGKP